MFLPSTAGGAEPQRPLWASRHWTVASTLQEGTQSQVLTFYRPSGCTTPASANNNLNSQQFSNQ